MADKSKGVKVTAIDANVQVTKHHEEAISIDVKDGHLLVCKAGEVGPDNVAIYAPGKWLHAVVL